MMCKCMKNNSTVMHKAFTQSIQLIRCIISRFLRVPSDRCSL